MQCTFDSLFILQVPVLTALNSTRFSSSPALGMLYKAPFEADYSAGIARVDPWLPDTPKLQEAHYAILVRPPTQASPPQLHR